MSLPTLLPADLEAALDAAPIARNGFLRATPDAQQAIIRGLGPTEPAGRRARRVAQAIEALIAQETGC